MTTSLADEFIEMVCHHWQNLHQARFSPNEFAHIHVEWFTHRKWLYSKQWHHCNGTVYRERAYDVEDRGNLLILSSENYPKFCISKTNYGFYGKTADGVKLHDGTEIESKLFLSNVKMEVIDIGRLNGKLLWGEVPGPFIFHKSNGIFST
jgi:hypothetical protein